MNTSYSPPHAISEHDIRAYAEHLYEQGGRIPGRDLDNWLEAEACLRANVGTRLRRSRRHRQRERGQAAHRFTMPPCDTSLWIEKAACVGIETTRMPPVIDEPEI